MLAQSEPFGLSEVKGGILGGLEGRFPPPFAREGASPVPEEVAVYRNPPECVVNTMMRNSRKKPFSLRKPRFLLDEVASG